RFARDISSAVRQRPATRICRGNARIVSLIVTLNLLGYRYVGVIVRYYSRTKFPALDECHPVFFPPLPHCQNNPRTSRAQERPAGRIGVSKLANKIPTWRYIPEIGVEKIQHIFPLDRFVNKLHHLLVQEHRVPTRSGYVKSIASRRVYYRPVKYVYISRRVKKWNCLAHKLVEHIIRHEMEVRA